MNTQAKIYRVALLSSGLGHVHRGIETWTEDLAACLAQQKIAVTLYKGGGRRKKGYEKVISCLHRDNPFSRWVIKNRPGFLWRFGLGTGYILEETTFVVNLLPELLYRQYDIIHTQDPQVADFLQSVKKSGLLKSKVILAHGTEEPFDFLKRFEYVQHLAPFHQQEMEHYGRNGTRSFAIGNFINTEHFKPEQKGNLRRELNIPENAFVVLSVAAIKRTHKRIDYLIEEFSHVQDSNAYLVIVGSHGEETRDLVSEGKEKLGQRVIFLANYSRHRIHEVYGMADLFVLCSLKEMMPIAILEALASGVPVVGHRYPVIEWMVGTGGEGIDMSQKNNLARTIQKYSLDQNLRNQKSQLAREQAVNHFSEGIILKQILEMYREVLES